VLVNRLQRAVGFEQLDAAFFADALDAGDVVGRVAHQGLQVDELRRIETVVGFAEGSRIEDLVAVPGAAGSGQADADPVGHELEQVAVAGDDQHVHVLGGGLVAQRAEQIVGLVAVDGQERDVEGLH